MSDSYHMTNLIHQGTDGLTLDCACLVSRPPPVLFFDLRSHGSRRVVKNGEGLQTLIMWTQSGRRVEGPDRKDNALDHLFERSTAVPFQV